MTTVLDAYPSTSPVEDVTSPAHTGESHKDRQDYLRVVAARVTGNTAVGATYYSDEATDRDQFPYTD